MASILENPPVDAASWPIGYTVANLLNSLGDVQAARIILNPAPGQATEQDLLRFDAQNQFCELIDGALVEKAQVGFLESNITFELICILGEFLRSNDLGMATGPDGPYRLMPGNVRYPDIAFIRWTSLEKNAMPAVSIAPQPPELAIEILSPGNTKKEMDRKLRDYFTAGVQLVWYIDPAERNARCYTSPDGCVTIDETGELVGDPILPGFRLRLGELFARATRRFPPGK